MTGLFEAIFLAIIITRMSKIKHDVFTFLTLIYCLVLAIFSVLLVLVALSRNFVTFKIRSIRKHHLQKYGECGWFYRTVTAYDMKKDLIQRHLNTKTKRFTEREGATCCIDMEEFNAKDEIIRLNCSKHHIFHKQCIVDWFAQEMTCPLCKAPASVAN